MESYRIKSIQHDEVSLISALPLVAATWNLFWLSTPDIDKVPTLGQDWWREYRAIPGAAAAVIRDTKEDEVLMRKLTMHPYAFSSWFEREDHSIYDCYYHLGQRKWVSRVLERAEMAGDRITKSEPAVSVQDNVLHVNFRRAA